MSLVSQQEQQLELDAQLEEDRLLRDFGHLQTHIYSFRAAGLSFQFIRYLPVPWFDTAGQVAEQYWDVLHELGVPTQALPARFAKPRSRDEEFRDFASSSAPTFAASTPTRIPPQSSERFAQRFGSPIRPLNLAAPATPARLSATSTLSAQQPNRGFSSAPPSQSPTAAPTAMSPNTPTHGSSDLEYCKHVDFVVAAGPWANIRQKLVSTAACQVLQAFALTDKQFQQALQTAKVPDSLKDAGLTSFSIDAWRDLSGGKTVD